MRLALDATALDPTPSGARRRLLCLALAMRERGAEPILFSNRRAATVLEQIAEGVPVVRLGIPAHPAPLRQAFSRRVWPSLMRSHACRFLLTDLVPPPRVPTVLTVHDLRAWETPDAVPALRRRFLRRHLPPALTVAHTLVVPSRATADAILARFGGSIGPTPLVVPNAGDHLSAPRSERPRGEEFLAVGPWDRRKALDLLLAARASLPSRPPLLLVGAGPSLPRRLPEGVTALGAVSDRELVALLRRVRALVAPSRAEGSGIPLLEARGQGCPLILSDIPAHRESAQGAALWFPVGDRTALAEALAGTPPPPTPLDTGWGEAADALLGRLGAAAD